MNIDYRINKYCSYCREKKPIYLIRCNTCNQILRSRPRHLTDRKIEIIGFDGY